MADKFTRMTRSLPALYKAELNTVIRGLLKAWAVGDDEIEVQIENTKDQLFVEQASGVNLDRLGNNVGVTRATELGIDDDDFRKLVPVLSFFPKQVRKTIIALLDVFWGEGFTRPNVSSGNIGPFNFGTPSSLTGTLNFVKDSTTVNGTGTLFTTELQVGDYIKPQAFDGTSFAKISGIIDDTTLELSLPWESNTAIGVTGVLGPILELDYTVDNLTSRTLRFVPNAFSDLTSVTIAELITYINSLSEHNQSITADEFLDPILGTKLNIRTNTPGLQGAIQITGGTANAPGILNFPTDVQEDTRVRVIEVNPNEIVVQIPSSVPVLRRTLRGSAHPRETKAEILSSKEVFDFSGLGASSTLDITIDSTPTTVTFTHATDFADATAATAEEVRDVINAQLTFLRAFTSTDKTKKAVVLQTTEGASEYQVTGGTANTVLNFDTTLQEDPDLIEANFPSSYVFDPVGQLFTVTGTTGDLNTAIGAGAVQSTIDLVDASSFPNLPGKILFDFGRKEQEGPIDYTSRPNNSTLLIDASHVFANDHATGRKVNLISDAPTIPRLTGDDYPVYIVGTEEARAAAQDLIRQLLAAGVVIRFEINFPEFLFLCTCQGCGPADDADLRGSLTNQGPLTFF